jgi:hypothetical protein
MFGKFRTYSTVVRVELKVPDLIGTRLENSEHTPYGSSKKSLI